MLVYFVFKKERLKWFQNLIAFKKMKKRNKKNSNVQYKPAEPAEPAHLSE